MQFSSSQNAEREREATQLCNTKERSKESKDKQNLQKWAKDQDEQVINQIPWRRAGNRSSRRHDDCIS